MTMNEQSATDTAFEPDPALLDRFKTVLERVGTLQKAAALTGFSAEQVAKWRDGKARLPFWPVAVLAREARLTLQWLAFGDSAASDGEPPSNEELAAWEKDLEERENVVWVPLLDVIASAGPGYENARPFEIDQLPFPRSWLMRLGVPEQFARFLDSRGDSMEPTIKDRAVCLVDTRFEHARKDGIYVLVDGPNVRIKRIAIGWQSSLVLISDNERYASETLAPPDAEGLRVAGKVVWAGGEI